MTKALFTTALLAALCSPAFAADYGQPQDPAHAELISELRLGIMAHDVDRREQGSIDFQAELLFTPFNQLSDNPGFFDYLLSPRPHIGASLNSSGDTSYGYAGLSWLFPVYGPVFIETSFGGAIHSGELKNVHPRKEPLGTRALFRESASIGFDYNQYRVMLTVEHLSNAGLGDWNHGLTHVGGRIGYKF